MATRYRTHTRCRFCHVTVAEFAACSPLHFESDLRHLRLACVGNLCESNCAMPRDTSLIDRVTDLLTARRVTFATKAMFGGLCFMVDDKMCLGVLDTRLMVRLDPALEAECLRREGCKPMDFTGRPMKGYVFIHPEGHETEAQLRHWVDLALAFNPRAKSSRKRG